jgi:hypothetical protein
VRYVDEGHLGLVDNEKNKQKKRLGQPANRQARHAIPVWLAFATTVYLDIGDILGPGVGRAFQELRMTSTQSIRTLNRHFKWVEGKKDVSWTKEHDELLQQVQHMLQLCEYLVHLHCRQCTNCSC